MKINYLILLVVISIFALFPLFFTPYFDTHDGDLHLARMAQYYKEIQGGNYLVRWGADLNYGFGHPVLIFMYPLPTYAGSLLSFLGFTFLDSFKLIETTTLIGSILLMFLFLKELFKDENSAFFGALLYGFAPYRFLDMYVRGDIGEEFSFLFLPLVLLSLLKIKNKSFILIGGISFSLLILSHNAYAFIFTPIIAGFATLLVLKNRKILKSAFLMLTLGLLLSSFFWLPALWESKYTQAKILIGTMFAQQFPNPLKLLYSPWGFGSEVNHPGGFSPQIGIAQILTILLFIAYSVFKKVRKDKYLFFAKYFFVVFLISIFFMLPTSKTLWELIPFMPYLQFPWRIVGVTVLCASVIGAYLFSRLKYKLNFKSAVVLGIIIFLLSTPFLKTQKATPKSQDFYLNFNGDTTWHGQANSIWTEGNMVKRAKSQMELIGGEGLIQNFKKESTKHTFTISGRTETQILDNTVYFPGWKAKVDGKEIPIEFQDMNHRGLITFRIPKGVHEVAIQFGETKIRLLGDLISLIALLFTLGILSRRFLTFK